MKKKGNAMKAKKLLSLILAVIMLMLTIPSAAFAEGSLSFSMLSSVPSDEKIKLGDTVTYTVKVTEGIESTVIGTLYFKPSDNLTYVSATLLGADAQAIKAENQSSENFGAYGILVLIDALPVSDNFCTITFKVTGKGNISVNFYADDFVRGPEDNPSYITPMIENGTVSHESEELTAPTITTSELPEAVKGYSYEARLQGTDNDFLTWEATEPLPAGLTLSADGTISGVPEVFGSFNVTVKATLFGELTSESKSIPLTILESPRQLELDSSSAYSIDENGYLNAVIAKTNLSTLLSNFKNSERIKVFNASGDEIISDTAYIGTGYTVSLVNGEEKTHTVTVVVKGDVDGDATITVSDYANIRLHYMNKQLLNEVGLKAGDVDGDTTITVSDYANVRLHYMNRTNIYG